MSAVKYNITTLQESVRCLINKHSPAGSIDNVWIAALMAQMHIETWGFTRYRESMRYKDTLIKKLCPKLDDNTINYYANNEVAWANYFYSNSVRGKALGNGSVESGDGWRFRGIGLIQLTGRTNISAYLKYRFQVTNIDSDDSRRQEYITFIPDMVTMPSAFNVVEWYLTIHNKGWLQRHLKANTDITIINKYLTKLITGNVRNLGRRLEVTEYYLKRMC